MNENDAPIVEDTATENIPASEGGITTTPEEIAQITGKPVVVPTEEADDEDASDEDADEDEDSEDVNTDEDSNDDDEDTDSDDDDADDSDDSDDDEDLDDDADASGDHEQEFALTFEDANGTEFTLKPGDDIEKALAEFEPKSNGQIFKVLNDFQKLEAAKTEHDNKQATLAVENERKEAVAKINAGWQDEIKELQGQKRIAVQADGKENERVEQVFEFMAKENDKREEKGRPLINSFEDALDKLELREHREAEKEKAKAEKDEARKNGGLVGGSSAPATGKAPVYMGGARNAAQASRMLGLRK